MSADGASMRLADYYDLGGHSWPQEGLTTDAQTWFDRGLNWVYGYNHLEALKCFDRCLAISPGSTIAEWGAAYALGPNYNATWATIGDPALAASRRRALAAAEMARTPLEKLLTAALLLRYPQDSKGDANPQDWDCQYAEALLQGLGDFRDCADYHALTAEALMCITPWGLWDVQTGEPAAAPARAEDARRILEQGCAMVQARGDPPHPGLCHLLVHLFEMSSTPERALPQADALAERACATGHLTHMSTHIYILVGDYYNAMLWNDRAARVDQSFLEREGYETFYTLYAAHNIHFKMYAAMFMGHYARALAAVEEIEALLPESLLRKNTPAGFPFINVGDSFIALRFHVWVRFGKWAEILGRPFQEDRPFYCVTTCSQHYARALAFALQAEPDLAKAEEERQAFEAAYATIPTEWMGIPGLGRRLHNNTARDILDVSRKMLEGELAYRRGKHDEAFALLREAGRLESSPPEGKMIYDEPWGFMQPTRHALGALLLDQGRLEEAEKTYREDLGLDRTLPRPYQHPDNVWALHGLVEVLQRLGKPDAGLEARLQLVAARADTAIGASCFCRTSAAACCKS